jgi:hypothetical protein
MKILTMVFLNVYIFFFRLMLVYGLHTLHNMQSYQNLTSLSWNLLLISGLFHITWRPDGDCRTTIHRDSLEILKSTSQSKKHLTRLFVQ